jgi:hypothetical protein
MKHIWNKSLKFSLKPTNTLYDAARNTKLLPFSNRKNAIKSQQIGKIDFLLHVTRPKSAIKKTVPILGDR